MMDNEYDCRLMEAMGLYDSRLHFNEAIYEKAVSGMKNEDGTSGAHYKIEECEKLLKQHEIELKENNIYDWAYSLNMVYSDYGKLLKTDKEIVDFTKAFIFDEDAPEGKALKYYVAMSRK